MNNANNAGTDPSKGELEVRLAKLERRGANARWWKLATLAMVVGFVLAPFAAGALGPVPNVFSAGEVISATEINDNFTHLQDGITANENQVPSNTIIFYNGSTCPTGWSEVSAARGRALVGLNGSAGTLAGTVGAALDDRENRTHAHRVNIGEFSSQGGGQHNHEWLSNVSTTYTSTGGATGAVAQAMTFAGGTNVRVMWAASSAEYYTDNEPNHTHQVDPPTSPPSTVGYTSQVMPYVQYLVCQRD